MTYAIPNPPHSIGRRVEGQLPFAARLPFPMVPRGQKPSRTSRQPSANGCMSRPRKPVWRGWRRTLSPSDACRSYRASAVQPMKQPRSRTRPTESIPKTLRVFAWNLRGRLTAVGKKQIALNVIERGRAWHWTQLPKGWFDLEFCLAHGQKKTKQTLRALFPDES